MYCGWGFGEGVECEAGSLGSAGGNFMACSLDNWLKQIVALLVYLEVRGEAGRA